MGGGGGIRPHVPVSRKHAFQACAFSHSATPPYRLARKPHAPPKGTTTCVEGGLFFPTMRYRTGTVGSNIVVTIGLTRHCCNCRWGASPLRPARAGVMTRPLRPFSHPLR